ncbi:hypothetical protein [uncultured Treponema sp.]|uniref:hypothetical protein n=1 Tax=uncultured Treponema sp. TaxID=162155 RepID=UPI0015BA3DD8|nr:hypothetical protein [uncultured Treponema sp.]
MKKDFIGDFLKDNFVIFTSGLSVILCALYVWKAFLSKDFFWGSWIVPAVNLLYAVLVFFLGRKVFVWFYLLYSVVLVFLIAFEKSCLFNNYTALFMLCIVIMMKPSIKYVAISLYFAVVSIAFLINEESIVHFLIHIDRSVWFLGSIFFVLNSHFEPKKLILFEDEEKILEQLCSGKIYQKEVEGFSENTVYRKLKAARERNGNLTREQLIELYKKQKMSAGTSCSHLPVQNV